MTVAMERVGFRPRQAVARAVRVDKWTARAFYVAPCRFFIDVPLDMSGCVTATVREAVGAGHRLHPNGNTFATDALFRGAILVEIEPQPSEDSSVITVDTELLARELPPKGVRLRAELDELVRWSFDLGHEVQAVFVQYEPLDGIPGMVRPSQVYAAIKGGRIGEGHEPDR